MSGSLRIVLDLPRSAHLEPSNGRVKNLALGESPSRQYDRERCQWMIPRQHASLLAVAMRRHRVQVEIVETQL